MLLSVWYPLAMARSENSHLSAIQNDEAEIEEILAELSPEYQPTLDEVSGVKLRKHNTGHHRFFKRCKMLGKCLRYQGRHSSMYLTNAIRNSTLQDDIKNYLEVEDVKPQTVWYTD